LTYASVSRNSFTLTAIVKASPSLLN